MLQSDQGGLPRVTTDHHEAPIVRFQNGYVTTVRHDGKLRGNPHGANGRAVAVENELVDWFNAVDLTYRTDLRELTS